MRARSGASPNRPTSWASSTTWRSSRRWASSRRRRSPSSRPRSRPQPRRASCPSSSATSRAGRRPTPSASRRARPCPPRRCATGSSGSRAPTTPRPRTCRRSQTFKTWVDNGWIDGPAANGLDYDQAWQEFAEGDGVFLPAGSWLTAGLFERMGEDVGFIAPPPGESGEVVAVAALSLPVPHLEQVGAPRRGRRRSWTSS